MTKTNLKLDVQKLNSDAKLPNRAYSTDSGADLFAQESTVLSPWKSELISTGVALSIPDPCKVELLTRFGNPEDVEIRRDGVSYKSNLVDVVWEIQIRSKSGLAAKHNVFVLNQPGTIDNEYTGEIKVVLFNASDFSVSIEKGQKIAQAILCPVFIPEIEEVDDVENTKFGNERGDNGFGSTGVK